MDEEKNLQDTNQEIKSNDEDIATQRASMLENKQQDVNIPVDISKRLELILDIPITVSFEIGSRKLQIEDIVKLSPSSIVELNKNIDQPIDIKVNGVLVAKGELYQVEDKFAVKIIQIISKEDRIKLVNSQLLSGG